MYVDIWKTRLPRPVVLFFYSLVFMVALILTAGAIDTVLPSSTPPNNLDDISIKFQYFTKHKDDYDVIFFGSSTTYQGIVPKIFDESIAANGQNIKSFNFGIMAANIAEMDFYLQKVLDLKPAKLKWIFLDCLVDSFMEKAPTSAKNIYWHTPLKTIENFQLIAESSAGLKEKMSGFYANLISFLYRWLGIGYFSNFWQQRGDTLPFYGLQQIVSGDKLLQEAGYYSMDWMKNSEEWKKNFQSNYLESYQQRLKQVKSEFFQGENLSTHSFNSYGIKMIQKMIYRINDREKMSKTNIESIFFIPPVLETDVDHSAIMQAYEQGYIPTLFAFNDPNTFATFYELDRRSDGRHLNHQGAQEFTRALAAEFSQYLLKHQKG